MKRMLPISTFHWCSVSVLCEAIHIHRINWVRTNWYSIEKRSMESFGTTANHNHRKERLVTNLSSVTFRFWTWKIWSVEDISKDSRNAKKSRTVIQNISLTTMTIKTISIPDFFSQLFQLPRNNFRWQQAFPPNEQKVKIFESIETNGWRNGS